MTVYKNGNLEGDAALEAALTAKSEIVRIVARGSLSGWVEQFHSWVRAELILPKSDVPDILCAITHLQAQAFACIAAQLLEPTSDDKLALAYAENAQRLIGTYMRHTREMLPEEKT